MFSSPLLDWAMALISYGLGVFTLNDEDMNTAEGAGLEWAGLLSSIWSRLGWICKAIRRKWGRTAIGQQDISLVCLMGSDTGFCSAMRFEEVSGPMLSLIQISAAALSVGLLIVPSRIAVTLEELRLSPELGRFKRSFDIYL